MTQTRAQSNGHGQTDAQSLGELVATATRDLSDLVHKEVELAKAELSSTAKRAGIGAGAFTGSGLFAAFGVLFASVAVAFGLHALGLALGWSFLVVAGAYLFVASVMVVLGVRSIRSVGPPSRTIETVRDDITWARHPTRGTTDET
jgi:hypothetical protein